MQITTQLIRDTLKRLREKKPEPRIAYFSESQYKTIKDNYINLGDYIYHAGFDGYEVIPDRLPE